jgi:hypothetical protein
MTEYRTPNQRKVETELGNSKGGGGEMRVYETENPKTLAKVYIGNINEVSEFGGLNSIGFDIENISPEIRKKILIEFVLAKILHLLYPDSVPDRNYLYSKIFPQFEQEKVEGIMRFDEVETTVQEVIKLKDTDTEIVGTSKFKIRNEVAVKVPTEKGLETMRKWTNATGDFDAEMLLLGIKIDILNVGENFIKQADGKYKYIDSFTIFNSNEVVEKLIKKAGENTLVKHWIKRLENLLYNK